MAEKIAGSGLTYEDLTKLLREFDKEAVVSILARSPSTSKTKQPRVTKTGRILAAIVRHFENTTVMASAYEEWVWYLHATRAR